MLFRKLQIAILLLCGMTLLATTVLPHHHRDDGAICLLIFENDSHDCASHAPSPCTPGCDHGCEGDDCPSRVSEIDTSSAKSFWYGVFVVPGYFHSGFVAAGVAFRRKRIYRTALHIPVSAHARFACSSFRGLIENPFSFSKEVWLRVGYAGSRSCYGSVSGMLFAVIILYGMKRRGVGLTN